LFLLSNIEFRFDSIFEKKKDNLSVFEKKNII